MEKRLLQMFFLCLSLAVLVMCAACGGKSEVTPVDNNGTETKQASDETTGTVETPTPPDDIPEVTPIALDDTKWEGSINENGTSELINHGNGEFEIQNPVANYAAFTQVVTVKPHTDYKFHVMYSMTDYQPGDENSVGACIAVQSTETSGMVLYGLTVGAAEAGATWGWNTYGLGFNSGDATSVLLYLSNGRNGAQSSGTAYFKDITLEEMSGTNEFTVIG